MEDEFKFEAFISYRHCKLDMAIAGALHKMLETYKIPKNLAGDGKPTKIQRVFRDREELPISANLSSSINEALHKSKYLLLICSPDTPKSIWVSKEVEIFINLGRADHIFIILTDGSFETSLPEPLKEHVELKINRIINLTKLKSTKAKIKNLKNEKIKIIAEILNYAYDKLRETDWRRKQFRILSIGMAVNLLFVLFGIYTYHQLSIAKEAKTKAESENKITMGVLNSLIYELPDKLRYYSSDLAITTEILNENIPVLNKIIDFGTNRLEATVSKYENLEKEGTAYLTLNELNKAEEALMQCDDIIQDLLKDKYKVMRYYLNNLTGYQLERKFREDLADCYESLGKVKILQGDTETGYQFNRKSLEINKGLFQELDFNENYRFRLASSYYNIAYMETDHLKSDQAKEYNNNAIELLSVFPKGYVNEEVFILKANCYYMLSQIETKDMSNALQEIDHAIEILYENKFQKSQLHVKDRKVFYYVQKADILRKTKELKEAKTYYHKAYDILNNDILGKGMEYVSYYNELSAINNSLAQIYEQEGDVKSAEKLLIDNITAIEKYTLGTDNLFLLQSLSLSYNYLGTLYLNEVNLNKAKLWYKKAVDLSVEYTKQTSDVILLSGLGTNYNFYAKVLGLLKDEKSDEFFHESRDVYQKLYDGNKDNEYQNAIASVYSDQGLIKLINGDYLKAIEIISKSYQYKAYTLQKDAQLSVAYALNGQIKEASKLNKKYQDKNDEEEFVKNIKQYLEAIQKYGEGTINQEKVIASITDES